MVVDQGSLDIQFDAAVGNYGTGTLKIINGGSVTAALASIASQAGANGAASVDGQSQGGTKSQWRLGGGLDVGGTSGTGLLSVTNGGTVSAGTSVQVWNSGTLSGNGTVNVNSGSGTATVDGTLAPNWTLSISGNLTFQGLNATMQCNVTPANLGSIDADVSRTATLTGKVSVTMTGTFTPGTRFTLLHAPSGLNGTQFSSQSINFPTGQGFTPKITYDANHVYLCLVPNTGGGCN